MNGLRQQLLARAAFSHNQRGDLALCGRPAQPQHIAHGRGVSEYIVKSINGLCAHESGGIVPQAPGFPQGKQQAGIVLHGRGGKHALERTLPELKRAFLIVQRLAGGQRLIQSGAFTHQFADIRQVFPLAHVLRRKHGAGFIIPGADEAVTVQKNHAFVNEFKHDALLAQKAAQAQLLAYGVGSSRHHAQRVLVVIFQFNGHVEYADQRPLSVHDRRGGTAPAGGLFRIVLAPDDFQRLALHEAGADAVGAVGFFRGVVARIKYDKALQFFFMPHGMNNQPGFVRQADNAA